MSLLNNNEQNIASKYKTTNKYKKGQAIFNEGFTPYSFYCILKGNVKLSRIGGEKIQILRFAKSGDIIGYRSLIADENYSTTAIAISDTTVCSLPKNIFLDELIYNSELSLKMLKQFAVELKQADELIINLTQKAGVKRIAETLIKIKDFYGQNDKTNALNISFSRNEIASIACVSTESCIRMLAELKKQGVINLVNREIQINDFPKLKIIANSK